MRRSRLDSHLAGPVLESAVNLTGSADESPEPTRPRTVARSAQARAVSTGRSYFHFLLLWLLLGVSCGPGAPQLVSIGVTKVNPTLAKGTTLQLTAMGTYSDQSLQDLTAQVGWASSDNSVGTVKNGLVTAGAVGTFDSTALLNGINGKTTVTVTSATLSTIEITPVNPVIAKGTFRSVVATGIFSDMSAQDLTSQVTWASSDNTIATVDAQGRVSGLIPGSCILSATRDGKTTLTTLTVTSATLVSISIMPTNSMMAKGTTPQFTATGIYTDNSIQDLTTQVNWTTANTSVATISNAAGSQGRAGWAGLGSTLISATLGDKVGNTTITGTAATLVSISVMPTNPSIAKGNAQRLTATGIYTDNSTQDLTNSTTWSSSDTTVAAMSNVGGSQGFASGLKIGSTTITAFGSGKVGSTTLSVTPAALVSISVMPTNPSIAKGTSQRFTATGFYTDFSTQDLTNTATWSSSDNKVAAISNAGGSQGLATGLGVGAAMISATLNGTTNSTTLNVTPATLVSILVTPVSPSAAKGTLLQLAAIGTYSDATTQDLTASVTWNSSDRYIATISNAAGSQGIVTAAQIGSTVISAALGAKSNATALAVTAATLASMQILPANSSIAAGTNRQLTAIGTYTDGSTQDLTAMAAWVSADEGVSTISNAAGSRGLATGLGVGTTSISAALGGKVGSTNLTGTTLVRLTITPKTPSLAKGATQQILAIGSNADGSSQDLTTTASWVSSDTNIATVSNAAGSQGLATALRGGSATLSATVGGKSDTTTLNVLWPGFFPRTQYPVSGDPNGMAVGDFNGDGKLDLVTSYYSIGPFSSSYGVSVILGTGTGSFGAATNYPSPAGAAVRSVAVGDFNGDGKLDLVIANAGSNSAAVRLGTGTGTFGAAASFSVGNSPSAVKVGDFNGDGNLDIVTANSLGANVSVLLGTGTGTFGTATNYAAGSSPDGLAVGDVNGDAKLDLIVANGGSSTVSILIGTGTGTFGAAANFTVGLGPNAVTVGDWNGDGKLDLATANTNNNTVSVLLGSGTGTFGSATDYSVQDSSPFAIVAADINGDGKADLATANEGGSLSVLLATGTGSFGSASTYPSGVDCRAVVAGDFNGDMKLDLAVANDGSTNVSVFLNQP